MDTANPTEIPVDRFDWSPRPLRLASRSPRRALLLRQAGIEFEVIESGFDDSGMTPPPGAAPAEWAVDLAKSKAAAALERVRRTNVASGLILAADTLVECDGEIIGQPRDEIDARRIIKKLSDRKHFVITGVAIIDVESGAMTAFSDLATVDVGTIRCDQVESYLATGEWRGKAGAYNLVERIEAGWPISFEGDAGTIMGLPMRRLAPLLKSRGESGSP